MIALEDVVASHGPDEPARFIAIADHFLQLGDREAAAAALDRAYGLDPDDRDLAAHRAAILDELAITDAHGLIWRYVPAGTFLMGSSTGEPDERPIHARREAAFWITDAPIGWVAYHAMLKLPPPPYGLPPDDVLEALGRDEGFLLWEGNKIRRQYAMHDRPRGPADASDGGEDELGPYAGVTMIAPSHWQIAQLSAALSSPTARVGLPTEAQWEKAARGGLVGKRYAWGDDPPTPARCDFDHMGDYRVLPARALPPNGYGIHGACGGVAEWTADVYDALAYDRASRGDLTRQEPARTDDVHHVLRGGSWADCAEAVTVSFRASRAPERSLSPALGFRLVRVTVGA